MKERAKMKYQAAAQVLPEELTAEIQKYIDERYYLSSHTINNIVYRKGKA